MVFAEVGGTVKRPAGRETSEIRTRAFAVQTPWGTLRIPEEGLCLGRSHKFSPYADYLTAHDNVSGRHAILRPVATGVEVADCSSTNGTFVNGTAVAPERPVVASADAIVHLGCDPPLELRVVET